MLWENSKTRRALRRVFRKAEDAGRLSPVKDDNAAKGVPVCPAGICALVRRRYPHIYAKCRDFFPFFSVIFYRCIFIAQLYSYCKFLLPLMPQSKIFVSFVQNF